VIVGEPSDDELSFVRDTDVHLHRGNSTCKRTLNFRCSRREPLHDKLDTSTGVRVSEREKEEKYISIMIIDQNP